MWVPSISPAEVVVLILVAVPTILLAASYSRWFLGVIACFALVMLGTPSDPGSTLVGGALLSGIYGAAVIVTLGLVRDKDS